MLALGNAVCDDEEKKRREEKNWKLEKLGQVQHRATRTYSFQYFGRKGSASARYPLRGRAGRNDHVKHRRFEDQQINKGPQGRARSKGQKSLAKVACASQRDV